MYPLTTFVGGTVKIRRGSFITQVAYLWVADNQIPHTTSLCVLFWRFWFGVVTGFVVSVFFICALAILFFLGFFMGQRPAIPKGDSQNARNDDLFRPYSRWPKFRGHRVWPVVPLVTVFLIWIIVPSLSWMLVLRFLFDLVVVVTAIALVIFVVIGANKVRRTETWSLTKEWFKAKKQKVCPLVEIVPE